LAHIKKKILGLTLSRIARGVVLTDDAARVVAHEALVEHGVVVVTLEGQHL
jgi:hypothetical protein